MPITAVLHQGSNCSISNSAHVGYREHGGSIVLGNNVRIMHRCVLRTCTGIITLGNNVSVGYEVIMHALGNITVGDHTLLSPRVQIYAQNHGIMKGKTIGEQKQTGKGVIIGKDCWIGAGVIICDGVTIETGSVIGAGSVVISGTYGQYGIYAGSPAIKIGERK